MKTVALFSFSKRLGNVAFGLYMEGDAFNDEGNYDYRGDNEDKIGDKRCERVFFSFLFLLFSH